MDARIVFYIFASVYLIIIKSYALSEEIDFSYEGTTGPQNWGTLCPNCNICSTGELQSPIDIPKHKVVINFNLRPLMTMLNYSSANATLINSGHDVMLKFENNSAGFFNLDGKAYTLKQLHWHTPAEHRINGIKFDAELHVVHVAEDGNMIVVGVLYQYGLPDPLLTQIRNELAELVNQHNVSVGTLNTRLFAAMLSNNYYRYNGSLTTPPCKEKVIWYIVSQVRSISRDQVQALKAPLDPENKNNSRPLQPLNNRTIEFYLF